MIKRGNLYADATAKPGEEVLETLAGNDQIRIVRIVSNNAETPVNTWYEQEEDEWVVVLQGNGVVEIEDGETINLNPGDWIHFPPFVRHRVAQTSADPPCIWLAVHGRWHE